MRLLDIEVYDKMKLEPINTKLFRLADFYDADFVTDEGVWRLRNKAGWITDLRSGTSAINYIIPKWGNEKYNATIALHDTAFSGWMSFELANELLYQGMILSGQIGSFRAGLAKNMVSLFGRSGYRNMYEELPSPYTNVRQFESLKLWDK